MTSHHHLITLVSAYLTTHGFISCSYRSFAEVGWGRRSSTGRLLCIMVWSGQSLSILCILRWSELRNRSVQHDRGGIRRMASQIKGQFSVTYPSDEPTFVTSQTQQIRTDLHFRLWALY